MKEYKNSHHFNQYTLIHHTNADGSITREWKPEIKLEKVYQNNKETGKTEAVTVERPAPPPLKKTVFATDGSETLESMADDICLSFCFTGCSWKDDFDEDLFRNIYETKLPEGTEVHHYDVGRVCQGVVERLDSSSKIDAVPKNYYELFGIMGLEREYGDVKYSGKYIIWQYPDSVTLDFEVKGNKIFFGFSR
jgi:hypothetical protein